MPDCDSNPKKRARPGEASEFVRAAAESHIDECIVWPQHWSSVGGYGLINNKGKMVTAHRLALSLATGVPLDDPRHAAHGPCHNTRCVNPSHLSWKTRSENQQDRLRDGTDARGENHGQAKLTEQQVLEIRESSDTGKALAEKFGIGETQVSRIKLRKKWGWL